MGSIHAKRDAQVETLSYVLIPAMSICSVTERRPQAPLPMAEEPMEIVETQPTGRWMLDKFQKMRVMSVDWERLVPRFGRAT